MPASSHSLRNSLLGPQQVDLDTMRPSVPTKPEIRTIITLVALVCVSRFCIVDSTNSFSNFRVRTIAMTYIIADASKNRNIFLVKQRHEKKTIRGGCRYLGNLTS
jgi:hypothetical protein